jgi:nitrate/TMAO reductase-like tetraheme cytochrome c subunit
MTQKQPSLNKKRIPVVPIILIGLVVGVVLAISGFGFAASQETHDAFCASCHTQPESTFFQRSSGAQPVDLASFHTAQQAHCIDCHSGQGLVGRVTAELMGARNAFKWYTGTAIQPAVVTFAIGDQNCTKCHQDVTQQGFTPKYQITIPGSANSGREGGGRANHYHLFLARWQAASPTAGTCISCHSGHAAGSTAQNGFMDAQNVQDTCNACHRVLRTD